MYQRAKETDARTAKVRNKSPSERRRRRNRKQKAGGLATEGMQKEARDQKGKGGRSESLRGNGGKGRGKGKGKDTPKGKAPGKSVGKGKSGKGDLGEGKRQVLEIQRHLTILSERQGQWGQREGEAKVVADAMAGWQLGKRCKMVRTSKWYANTRTRMAPAADGKRFSRAVSENCLSLLKGATMHDVNWLSSFAGRKEIVQQLDLDTQSLDSAHTTPWPITFLLARYSKTYVFVLAVCQSRRC